MHAELGQNLSPDLLVDQALALFEAGQSLEAGVICRQLVRLEPGNVTGLQLLGLIALDGGRFEEADHFLAQALQRQPEVAEAHNSRGIALFNLGRFEQAVGCYDQAIKLRPDFAEAHNNRGTALLNLGHREEALHSFDTALAQAPSFIEALYNRGTALLQDKAFDLALTSFNRVVELAPSFAAASYNRALCLVGLGRYTEALNDFNQAVALQPDFLDAWLNRGIALVFLGRFDDAIACYDNILEFDPAHADALRSRGLVLEMINRPADAADNYLRLTRVNSGIGDAASYLEAISKTLYAQMMCCDWTDHQASIDRVDECVTADTYPVQPFSFIMRTQSAAKELQCARQYVAHKFPIAASPMWPGKRSDHDRIRIAYLSSDFREHAVAYLAAELFELHDRSKFELYGISFWPDDGSEMRKRLVAAFDHFADVINLSDEDAAKRLREMEIDIAVHLNGHTEPGRLTIMSHRPAPIQVNYLGYPGTLGAPFIDYIIVDPVIVPPGYERFYTEKVVRLPDCYQINDTQRAVSPDHPTRTQLGLPEKGFVFCAFNRNAKITPAMFDVWMRLLRRVPGSVLWLFEGSKPAVRNLCQEAERRGIPAGRLVFAPFMKLANHLARLSVADLFLDTFPYTGHTTASDALWVGVPVVTCMGETFASRVAGSLLHTVGIPELITTSAADYEALAFNLATDPVALGQLRSKLAANIKTAPLFDADRTRRHIENAYMQMWKRHQAGRPAESFSVEPASGSVN